MDIKKNETSNDRIKMLRKALEMTQEDFASYLGIQNTAVSKIENSESGLSEQNIFLICTQNRLKDGYTVNEEWLRTGKGEMFITAIDPDIFDDQGNPLNHDEGTFIRTYRKLTPPNKEVAKTTVDALLKSQGSLGADDSESAI